MVGKYVRCIVVLVLVLRTMMPLAAQDSFTATPSAQSGDLLLAAEPILYGEASFLERIGRQCADGHAPVGLVLSGGSARAFAHIGVLKRMEESGIIPDFIVSNSMGSIVGLLYAAGLSPDQILSLCSTVDIGRLFDLTLPLQGGLLDTARFAALVSLYVGTDLRVEELPIPIMVIAEDLVTKRQLWIAEGDFLTILESSFVLPVYFSPVEYQGHLLIDGGITNLVPLDAASRYSDDLIVSTTFYEGAGTNLRNSLVILNTSIDIAKRRRGVEELLSNPQALWIRCDVESFSFMDFKSLDLIARQGYLSASRMDDQLQRFESRCQGSAVLDVRSTFEERQAQVLADYRLYNHVPVVRLSQRLFPAVRSGMPESFLPFHSDPFVLRDNLVYGASYSLDWNKLGLTIDGGFGWEGALLSAWYPEVLGRLTYSFSAATKASVAVGLSWDRDLLPSWYNSLALETRSRYADDKLSVSLRALLEHDLSPSFALQEMVMAASAGAQWDNAGGEFPFKAGASAGILLSGTYDRWFSTTEARAELPLPLDLSIDLGTVFRIALDGKGEVPLYGSDGFKTGDTRILSQGSLVAEQANVCNHAVLVHIGPGWIPADFKPTFGEALIVERTRLGLFCSLLWYRQGQIVPATSLGIDVAVDFSFLGLNSIPFRAFAGFEMPLYKPVWGFVVGR